MTSPASPPRSPWRFWLSPPDQPGWARPNLLGITALAALLYIWQLPNTDFPGYYGLSVRSMAESWTALFYGALDPGATVTLDKLAGAFVPQALSVRLFGFHAWALALPNVIAGIITVLVMYRVVRRWAGPKAGILATTFYAFTPLMVSMFGHAVLDGVLILCLVLAADACQTSIYRGQARWLLLAAVWIGLGFQAKMLQSWIVLPALALGYLLAVQVSLFRRLAHLFAAFAIAVAVSFSWTTAMSLTPAEHRPYADATTSNSMWAMVLGYNGLERFGVHYPGAVSTLGSQQADQQQPGQASPGQAAQNGPGKQPGQNANPLADPEIIKLFVLRYLTQIAWLLPLLLVSLSYGLARWRRQDRVRNAGWVMWGSWLVVSIAVFTKTGIAHTAYLATLAPAIAALCGAGAVQLQEAFTGRRRATRWLLPATVLFQGLWASAISWNVPGFLSWLAPLLLITTALVTMLLVLHQTAIRLPRRLLVASGSTSLVAVLLAPTVWSASVIDPRYDGNSFDAEAGSVGHKTMEVFKNLMTTYIGPGAVSVVFEPTTTLNSSQRQLVAYLTARRRGAEYLFATDSWGAASPYIFATGERIIPMGGFSGSVPNPTLARAKQLVTNGKLRFFLLTGVSGLELSKPTEEHTAISSWVRSACQPIPASRYGNPAPRGPNSLAPLGTPVAYEC